MTQRFTKGSGSKIRDTAGGECLTVMEVIMKVIRPLCFNMMIEIGLCQVNGDSDGGMVKE